jgi:D-alanyl-D-alanine carboxypeptidase
MSPNIGMFRLVSDLATGTPGSSPAFRRVVLRDSTGVTVRLTGTYAVGGAPLVMSIPVEDPSEYAERALVAALEEHHIAVGVKPAGVRDRAVSPFTYADSMRVAEHVVALAEEIKVTLKVSQNLHAS